MRRISWLLLAVLSMLAACVSPAPPAPVAISTAQPPWKPPRDAISHIKEAGMPELPLNDTSDPHVFTLSLTINGNSVAIPGGIGVDKVRAIQAPVHTHDDSGQVWLEGKGNREVTLADFFFLWGVRFSESCLGAVCGQIKVIADGNEVASPSGLVLREVMRTLAINVTG